MLDDLAGTRAVARVRRPQALERANPRARVERRARALDGGLIRPLQPGYVDRRARDAPGDAARGSC